MAEPGDPHNGESNLADTDPTELISETIRYSYQCYETGKDRFHQNVQYILNLFWPGLGFEEKMTRTWITESVLCSAKKEGGNIPARICRECTRRYLKKQLDLLGNATVVAIGSKARDRTKGIPGIQAVGAAAPPGCNFKGVRESWHMVARDFQKKLTPIGTSMKYKKKRKKDGIIESSKVQNIRKDTKGGISMKSNEEKLQNLTAQLAGQEKKIAEKLGGKILKIGDISVMEGNKTYDLAFKSIYKPSFATFITHTLKPHGGLNKNDIPDSLVVQIRFKNLFDPDRTGIPKEWYVDINPYDRKKDWFSFRLKDAKPESINKAFKLVKRAYDSV